MELNASIASAIPTTDNQRRGNNKLITHLLTEYLSDPLGIDARKPRLRWQTNATVRGWKQAAYRILVDESPAALGQDIGGAWDSGQTAGDGIAPVVYEGVPLKSATRYYWKVKTWNDKGSEMPWSDAAYWETGLLEAADWIGQWIGYEAKRNPLPTDERSDIATSVNAASAGENSEATTAKEGVAQESNAEAPAPLLRTTFRIDREVERARIYVSALGYYEVTLNGTKVGEQRLDPGFTVYDKRSLYATHDVTALLSEVGEHCLGAELGRGFYGLKTGNIWYWEKAPWNAEPKLLIQLHIRYADGTETIVASDGNWSAAEGPRLVNSLYTGDTYDARKEIPGWNLAGFDASRWERAQVGVAASQVLQAQAIPPIREVEEVAPATVTSIGDDRYVIDFDRVMAGNVRIRVEGPAGTTIKLIYGETVSEEGAVNQDQTFIYAPFQTDTYVLKGKGIEVWQPVFSYKGFKYVQVEGWPGAPQASDFTAIIMRTDLARSGHFSSSNPLFNAIFEATATTFLNNAHSIPTDTPMYEKNGWMGDAQLISESSLTFLDIQPLWEKWTRDMDDSRLENGAVPVIVPSSGWGQFHSPEWQVAYLFIPMAVYRHSGDSRVLEEHYEGMKGYAQYEIDQLDEQGISNSVLGDWVPPGPDDLPPEGARLTSSLYAHEVFRTMAEIAEVLGRGEDAAKFAEEARKIALVIHANFYKPEKGIYETEREVGYRQCSNILPIAFGVADTDCIQSVIANLAHDVAVERNNHLHTGILGTKYILPVLTEHGHGELAYRVADNRDYPGWGYFIANGATTMWEMWQLNARSRNHYMFGTILDWFYRDLAGIRATEAGYRSLRIRPFLPQELQHAEASYRTPQGRVSSSWSKTASGGYVHEVTIPSNSRAEITFWTGDSSAVSENGTPLARVEGVLSVNRGGERTTALVGSGTYRFEISVD